MAEINKDDFIWEGILEGKILAARYDNGTLFVSGSGMIYVRDSNMENINNG